MKTLLIPSVRKNNGTGHLKRCLLLAEQLTERGEQCSFYLNIEKDERETFLESFPSLGRKSLYWDTESIPRDFNRIIIDNRDTSREKWLEWEKRAPVIFIDEGGEARKYGSFLIDTLPSLSREEANILGHPLLQPVENIPEKDANGKETRILITFGGEDPAGLTLPALNELLKYKEESPLSIGVVQGPMAKDVSCPGDVVLYKSPPSLAEIYNEYDLVITSFGLTPYEAEERGLSILLVNPSSYHEKLTRKAGFLSAGVGKKGIGRLRKLLEEAQRSERENCAKTGRQLWEIMNSLGEGPTAECPLCREKANPVIQRFGDRSFYRCRRCRNYYLVNWNREEEIYDREYFFSRYKAQYGQTYLDDFDNIKSVGKGRLKEIEKCLQRQGKEKSLLTDLGCAYGPFLAAAKDEGYDCRGVEINRDGAEWVEKNLEIPVIRGSLEDRDVVEHLMKHPGDVVTLWYVIEHIPQQDRLLENIAATMKRGGVLAFGTPSGRGISARKNRSRFLKSSPADHCVIYTPRGAKNVLARHGFKVVKVKSVGHHPERFGRWVGQKCSFSYNVVMLLSRCFSLGDSLEVYAVKTAD